MPPVPPPMPPSDAPMMPPKGPPAGPPGGGASPLPPELQPDQIAAQLPEGSFKEKDLQRLVDVLNDALPVLAEGVDVPPVALPPMDGAVLEGKLPMDLAMLAVLILSVLGKINPKYAMTAADLDEKGIVKAARLIDSARGDKKVLAMLNGEPEKKSKSGPMPEKDDVSEEVEMKEEVKEKGPPPGVARFA